MMYCRFLGVWGSEPQWGIHWCTSANWVYCAAGRVCFLLTLKYLTRLWRYSQIRLYEVKVFSYSAQEHLGSCTNWKMSALGTNEGYSNVLKSATHNGVGARSGTCWSPACYPLDNNGNTVLNTNNPAPAPPPMPYLQRFLPITLYSLRYDMCRAGPAERQGSVGQGIHRPVLLQDTL